MKYHIIINSVKTTEVLLDTWTKGDYVALLDIFGLKDEGNCCSRVCNYTK